MSPSSDSRRTTSKPNEGHISWRAYFLRLVPAILLLIVLPIVIVTLLESMFSVDIHSEDRSLIYFFLFIFFVAYLAIDSHKTPLGNVPNWLRRLQANLQVAKQGQQRSNDPDE